MEGGAAPGGALTGSRLLEAVEDRVHLRERQILVIGLVDLDHGGGAAAGEALGGLQGHLAVTRGLAGLDAEPLLAVLEHLARAAQSARQRATRPQLVFADRMLVEQRVEG